MSNPEDRVDELFANLRQGDVVALDSLKIPSWDSEGQQNLATPGGVVVISQTCDVVQSTKQNCLVAPVIHDATNTQLRDALKGRKPLHLYIDSADGSARIADLEKIVAVPKSLLASRLIVARVEGSASGKAAREIASRIVRAFGRFPLPDEVHDTLKKFRDRVISDTGKSKDFSKVLGMVDEIRISADQWDEAGRNLTIFFIVSEELLPPLEDFDANWTWNSDEVRGAKRGENPETMQLHRICELILANTGQLNEERRNISDIELPPVANVLTELWLRFGEAIENQFFRQSLNQEVASCEVQVLSDIEMPLQQYRQTESLDLEVLSHSQLTG